MIGPPAVRVADALSMLETVTQDSNLWPLPSRGSGVVSTAACAIPLTSCPESEERTGIRFETERVYGYSGGARALTGSLSPGGRVDPGLASVRGWISLAPIEDAKGAPMSIKLTDTQLFLLGAAA
jgi:hypothetical protein